MKTNIALLFLALILGSFSDEAIQILFFLKMGDVERIYLISLLFMGGMVGGILANIYFSRLLHFLSLKTLLIGSLLLQSLITLIASVIHNEIFYLLISFIFGFLGSILWSAVLITIPSFSQNDEELEKINKYAHSIRNMGYMIGPAIGGLLFEWLNIHYAILIISLFTLVSALLFPLVLRNIQIAHPNNTPYVNGIRSIHYLLQNPIIKRTLLPLFFTIIFTSTMSILLVVYLTSVVKLTGDQYGIFASLVSLALTLSPILLIDIFRKCGHASAVALSAAMIGLAQFIISINENYLIFLFAALLMGAANGIHNALLSAFMLKHIAAKDRKNYMPAYVLILQSCVAIGFIISLFITQSTMKPVFMIFSLLTIMIGLIGAYFNRKSLLD